jgi:hypothetical protein
MELIANSALLQLFCFEVRMAIIGLELTLATHQITFDAVLMLK